MVGTQLAGALGGGGGGGEICGARAWCDWKWYRCVVLFSWLARLAVHRNFIHHLAW